MQETQNISANIIIYIVLVTGWALFYGVHSFLALNPVKYYIMQQLKLRAKAYRLLYNVVAALTLLAIFIYLMLLPAQWLFAVSRAGQYIGLVAALWGLFIIRLAFRNYSFKQFLGLEAEQQNNLTVSGMQSKMRHPIYTGTLLLFVGLFLYAPSIKHLISVLCLCAYLPIGIHLEEQKLMKQFGDAYLAYKKKVPALFPHIMKK